MSEEDIQSLTSHTSTTTTSTRPKKFICTFDNCDKAYNRPSLLEQHQRIHTGQRPYMCTYPECDKTFLRKSHLDAHLISHSREKPFHCSVCGKGVNTAQHLKRHEITHTKSFKCMYPNCNESFYKHQSLRHHILSVHEKTLTCKVCDKTFMRPSKLAQHKLKHHGESPAYQCDQQGCFMNFKTWSALQFHIKQEHPKLRCAKCGKGCVGKRGLQSHMLSHDESAKTWQCNYCDIGKFNKKLDLVAHYNEFHDGNLPDDLKLSTFKKKENNEEITNNANLKNLGSIFSTDNVIDEKKKEKEEKEENGSENCFGADIRSDTAQAYKSITSLNTSLLDGKKDIIKLISNDLSKKLICPKRKCGRTFSRDYDLKRHLTWHEENLKRIENFLNNLPETLPGKEADPEPAQKKVKLSNDNYNLNDDDNDYDDNDNDDDDDDDDDAVFDALLDSELKGTIDT
ncbi:PZF1 [Candida oxycetoniae]|uniref:Transcription factor IIIA n=1 Tax=Candida oxycetoniae TaxID=497107 RepID=A0AAI9SZJ4_9ASCO|nr:PZF1 [Candida oxycetoniae]KAI3405705.2 PZF1 [Candida oxycetoniae]